MGEATVRLKEKQEAGTMISDPFHIHDWNSKNYILDWAKRQDERKADRRRQFEFIADLIPFDRAAPIAILDIGAGYGALTQFLLRQFPNGKAVCQDGSAEMVKLGLSRMARLKNRFAYVLSDFTKPGWSKTLEGEFDAVVSSRAIHNAREPEIIRNIYKEIFPFVKAGGCFLNVDGLRPPVEEQLEWLKETGFKGVRCFWQSKNRSLFGGFKS